MKSLLFSLLVGFSSFALAQVTALGTVASGTDNNTSSLTLSNYTVPAGTDRIIVVGVSFRQGVSGNAIAITYGGQNLTESVTTNQVFSGGNNHVYSTLWYLALGAGGGQTGDVTIQFADNVNYAMASASAYEFVNQFGPIGSTGSITGIGTTSAITLPTDPQGIVVDNLLAGGGGGITPAAGQVLIANISNQSRSGNSYAPTTSGTTTVSWSKSNTSYTHVALELSVCTSCVPFPVEFVSLRAERRQDEVAVNWTVANEKDNAGYRVLKSYDATDWQVATFVAAKGTVDGDMDYVYLDRTPGERNQYYQIEQVDLDGTTSRSDVVSVGGVNEKSFTIYPNPALQRIYLRGYERGTVRILDHAGRTVLLVEQPKQPVDIAVLPTGTYSVVVADEQSVSTSFFIKQ